MESLPEGNGDRLAYTRYVLRKGARAICSTLTFALRLALIGLARSGARLVADPRRGVTTIPI